MLRPVVVAFIFLASAAAPLIAGDWPFIQGPTLNGHADDESLLDDWGENGPAVLWTRDLGQGYSSFVVSGNRCLTQYQSPLGQFVLCVDTRTGQTLWEHRYALPYEALGLYPGPRSTPTIAGERVVFAAPDGAIGCLELATGRELWSVNPKQQYDGQGTDFGYSASPVVVGELVILPIGGKGASIVALHLDSGDTAWATGNDSASYCPSLLISLEGQTLLVSSLENVLTLHDLQGRELGRESLSSGYDEHSAIPLFHEPLLIFAAPFRAGATAYELIWTTNEAGARIADFQIRWQSAEFSNDVVTSVVCNDVLCGFDLRDPQSRLHRPSRGTYRGLDPRTGQVLWSHEDIGQAGAIAVGNRLLLFNDRGQILLADVSREGLTIRSRADVFSEEVCWTRPVLSNGRLFLRTHSRAVCLRVGDSDTDSELNDVPLRILADIRSSPAVSWAWLLGGEREHPFMAIEIDEARHWYFASLWACLLPAWALAGMLRWFRLITTGGQQLAAAATLAVLLATITTPLLSTRTGTFTFTWPFAIYGAFQGAILASLQLSQNPQDHRLKRQARLAGLGFIVLCVAYYQFLKLAGEPMEWVFLLGPIPTAPLAVLVAHCALRKRSWWVTGATMCGAFTLSFWGALGLQALRSNIVERM